MSLYFYLHTSCNSEFFVLEVFLFVFSCTAKYFQHEEFSLNIQVWWPGIAVCQERRFQNGSIITFKVIIWKIYIYICIPRAIVNSFCCKFLFVFSCTAKHLQHEEFSLNIKNVLARYCLLSITQVSEWAQ